MGAWGYEPFDNDSALDWLGHVVVRPIGNTLKVKPATARRYKYAEQIAAADLLLDLRKLSYGSTGRFLKLASTHVAAALADEQYIASWQHPAKARAALHKLLRRIKAAIAEDEQYS